MVNSQLQKLFMKKCDIIKIDVNKVYNRSSIKVKEIGVKDQRLRDLRSDVGLTFGQNSCTLLVFYIELVMSRPDLGSYSTNLLIRLKISTQLNLII